MSAKLTAVAGKMIRATPVFRTATAKLLGRRFDLEYAR
jgi:hypothetical protein